MDLESEEIKLLNIVRVILQGGWIIDASVMLEILELSGVEAIQKRYVEWFEKGRVGKFDPRELCVMQSAWKATNLLGFPDFILIGQGDLPIAEQERIRDLTSKKENDMSTVF